MKKIGVKIIVLGALLVVFPACSMKRLFSSGRFAMGQKPIFLVPTDQSNVLEAKKTFTQSVWEKYPSLKSLSHTYQKIENQLQSLPVSSGFLSRIAFTFMTGVPIVFIDLTSWASWGKKLFSALVVKKLSFNQVYQKNPLRLGQSKKDELLIRLEKLANLSHSEKQIKRNSYQEEAELGEKSQAQARFFGSMYRGAIGNAETIDDIALLYESASMWLRLRIESGLYDNVANLKAEFDRIDQQGDTIIHKYDEQSMPIVKKYLEDMRQDCKDRFVRWLGEWQQEKAEEQDVD